MPRHEVQQIGQKHPKPTKQLVCRGGPAIAGWLAGEDMELGNEVGGRGGEGAGGGEVVH